MSAPPKGVRPTQVMSPMHGLVDFGSDNIFGNFVSGSQIEVEARIDDDDVFLDIFLHDPDITDPAEFSIPLSAGTVAKIETGLVDETSAVSKQYRDKHSNNKQSADFPEPRHTDNRGKIKTNTWYSFYVELDDLDDFCRKPIDKKDAVLRTAQGKQFRQLLKECETLKIACLTSRVHSVTVLQNCVNTYNGEALVALPGSQAKAEKRKAQKAEDEEARQIYQDKRQKLLDGFKAARKPTSRNPPTAASYSDSDDQSEAVFSNTGRSLFSVGDSQAEKAYKEARDAMSMLQDASHGGIVVPTGHNDEDVEVSLAELESSLADAKGRFNLAKAVKRRSEELQAKRDSKKRRKLC